MLNNYKILKSQTFSNGDFSIVPIRLEDRYVIMQWRNEQIYHLRQSKPLSVAEQDSYFNTVIAGLFEQEQPNQILFSYLEGNKCIGYGGLVHINWVDKNAEISFIMDTSLENEFFDLHWSVFLGLIEEVAFRELGLHKIYTYAFDLRPHLFRVLEKKYFFKDAVLKEHCYFEGSFKDVVIHSKLHLLETLTYRLASIIDDELLFNWANDEIVRQNSINSEPIEWENHCKWLNNKLNDENTLIYIFQIGEVNVGQVRIEIIDNYWHIDFSVDKKWRGKGIGLEILNRVIIINSDKTFVAYVKPENIISSKVFSKLGFLYKGYEKYNGLNLEKFVLNEN